MQNVFLLLARRCRFNFVLLTRNRNALLFQGQFGAFNVRMFLYFINKTKISVMKNQLIATLAGGVILFLWQFLSWTMLNVHGAEYQYTSNQDSVMAALAQNLKEGSYMLPQPAPGSSKEEQQAFMEKNMGKPWASISYHESFEGSMGMNMFRAIIVDFAAVFLLVWLLLKITNLDFKTALLSSLAVGAIAYLTIPYLNSIWFESNTIGYLVDWVAQWGLVGTWLGWWLTKR